MAAHGGKRKGIKLGHGGVMPIAVFRKGMPEAQPVREKRKQLSSVRLWQEDRPLLQEVLTQVAGEEPRLPDRMGTLLRWVRDRLEIEEAAAQTEQVGAMGEAETQLIEAEVEVPETAEPEPEIAAAGIEEKPPITVEAELVQEKETPAAVEEARAGTLKEPVTSGLEQKMDKLLDVMTQFVTLQLQPKLGQSSRERQASPIKQSNPAISKSGRSKSSEVGGQDKVKGERMPPSETEERIHRAIEVIMHYNSQPDLPHDLKWAITINTLKSFVKSQRKIEQILEERRAAIEAHHQVQQIDPVRQNLKHRRKRVITEVIKI